ncbi:hypothetical protein Q4489_00655 [Thalassotalea sp. 1_MG-2023]|uniref:carboxylate--amine ligase n=1 Tax=Thalassotalea sp. 1_MG-2023 TaxID=3062680 RepID=UPI0026E16C5D|nr:hypothetical protein [Thalassotalea sp. 1_MG-2023]MDO6425498.1 hypothetical protein [Thalassotalea sp. 1_MG-2023]
MTVEVVVVGSGLNALGVMRSLGHDVESILVTQENVAARYTKFGKKHFVASTTDNKIISELQQLGAQIDGRPVLLLTEEKTVALVSENRAILAEYFQFLLPTHTQLLGLQSKSDFQLMAEKSGSLIPKALIMSEATDIEAEALTFPCVFKPLYQDKAYSQRFKKAYKMHNWADVKALYAEISPIMPDMILQEWIEGEDSDIYFNLMYVAENGDVVTSFSGRKVRSWPLNVGGTASCTSTKEHHHTLHQQTKTFVESIGYVGLIGMEYKFDVNRKGFYMIEPTVGRTDYQHEIAALSGCNILKAIVDFHLGGSIKDLVSPSSYNEVLWFDEISDANALAHGGIKMADEPSKKFGALFRFSDLGPYFFAFKQKVKRRLNIS